MGAHKAAAATDAILQRLRVDYVDLLLVHWPGGKGVPADSPRNAALRAETWRVLEAARAAGKARAIGVSNFEPRHLAELPPAAAGGPAVNQIEVHPRWPARALRNACASRGAAVVAYSPLGCGHLVNDPTVLRIAAALGRTPAQVLLRWGLEKGCAVIPKSVRPERVCEFAPPNVLDGWRLGDEHTALLDALVDDDAGSIKYCWDPSGIK
jgi:diketogulonate reductase-like aldo/keto reductase